jgi:hypothetical protein
MIPTNFEKDSISKPWKIIWELWKDFFDDYKLIPISSSTWI